MTFFRSLLFVCPAVCLLAQTPPAQTPPPQKGPATMVPGQPSVTLGLDNPKPMPAVPPDRVIITVGDMKITAAQFDEMINALPEQSRASARGPARKQFADQLVKVMVLSQEGKRRKYDETPTFKMQVMLTNANALAGVTYDHISKEATLDEAELRKYYDGHKNEFEQVHARHILIRMQGSPLPVKPGQKELTDAEALAKAQELRKKIEAGGDFAALATAESDDTGSAAKGGDLGSFKKGQMVPAFEEAAFSMKPGELSQPVKSQFGYHIIKVESHDTKTFEEVKPDLEKRLRPEQAQKALSDLEKNAGVSLDPEFFGTAKQ